MKPWALDYFLLSTNPPVPSSDPAVGVRHSRSTPGGQSPRASRAFTRRARGSIPRSRVSRDRPGPPRRTVPVPRRTSGPNRRTTTIQKKVASSLPEDADLREPTGACASARWATAARAGRKRSVGHDGRPHADDVSTSDGDDEDDDDDDVAREDALPVPSSVPATYGSFPGWKSSLPRPIIHAAASPSARPRAGPPATRTTSRLPSRRPRLRAAARLRVHLLHAQQHLRRGNGHVPQRATQQRRGWHRVRREREDTRSRDATRRRCAPR